MPTLDVISVNLWQILISLANLTVLFLVLKHFLYAPVKKVLAERQRAVDEGYAEADRAREQAERYKADWEQTVQGAEAKAEDILRHAEQAAARNGDAIRARAEADAEGIVRSAEGEAELIRRRAEGEIRDGAVELGAMLAERLLGRSVSEADRQALIEDFLGEVDHD